MSNLIDSRDLKEALKMACDFLDNTNDRLEEDVADIVLANDGRNRDMDDFAKYFETAITYIDLYNRDKNRRSVFDSDRDMEEAVGKALTLSVGAFVAADKNLSEGLSDRDYDDVMDHAEKLEKMEDALEDLEREAEDRDRRGSRRGRDRDRDDRRSSRRDDRRSSRRRDRDTGRSSTRTDYRRGRDDRDDEREERRSSRRDRDDRKSRNNRGSNYGRKDPSKREEREEQGAKETMNVDPNEVLIRVPRRVPVKESIVKPDALPDEAASRVFNPSTHGAYAIAGEQGVYRAVLSHEEEDNVENYEAHELNRSLVGHDRKGERIVPLADFRGVKDPSDDETVEGDAPREPTIVYGEQINCVSTGERVPTHVLTGVLNEEAEYQVVNMNKYMPLTVVSSVLEIVNDEIGELNSMKRFNDFYNWITKAQEKKEDLTSRNDRFAMLGCLNALTEQLTLLANNLFSIVSNIPGMDNFLEDWPSAQAWLVNPEQADVYAAWQELEAPYLRHNFAVLSEQEVAEAATKGELTTLDVQGKDIQNLWVRAKQFVVLVDGDISGTIQMSNPDLPAKVEYELTPDFHTACMTLVNHRNRNLSMANIVLVDTVGSQYCILANRAQVPVIKVRML
ncbi:hypothetical protein pVa21_014 [Vibrio phage pVa-21]|nr:hypothetical protein pVa21_014 [Vibrio phage pVa-21]